MISSHLSLQTNDYIKHSDDTQNTKELSGITSNSELDDWSFYFGRISLYLTALIK